MGLTIENIPATRRREVATLLTAAFLADEHFARFRWRLDGLFQYRLDALLRGEFVEPLRVIRDYDSALFLGNTVLDDLKRFIDSAARQRCQVHRKCE